MEYRSFGKINLKVSAIGFGCWEVGGTYGRIDRGEFDRAVHQAIDSGITCFDTAEAYGMGVSEEALAEALGPRRNQVSIVTKFGTGYADPPRQQPRPRYGVDRQEPATAAHRPCRCLSRPLAGPGNAARRDGDRARRHRPARQGPLYRRLKFPAGADRGMHASAPDRCRAIRLEHVRPAHAGRDLPLLRAGRDRRDGVRLARLRYVERQLSRRHAV